MKVLILESTCDETAAAIVTESLEVLASVVASQDDLHRRFLGVVPEIAARAQVERILPVIDETLRRAGVRLGELDAVAVANTPGLAGSLLVGLAAAKALCVALGKPLVAVNHLHAHVFACQLASRTSVFPCVGLVASGGHTCLYACSNPCQFELLGGTIDDAAGEAFDKVASLMGLGYPGGPAIAEVAAQGNARAYRFPRSFYRDPDRLDFSFSGLKTAVRYLILGPGRPGRSTPISLNKQQIADIAASFQEAVVDSLVDKSLLALERTRYTTLCVGGGVAANERLRARLREATKAVRASLHIAPPKLCTDNAVMGAIALERLKANLIEPLDLDIVPGGMRDEGSGIRDQGSGIRDQGSGMRDEG